MKTITILESFFHSTRTVTIQDIVINVKEFSLHTDKKTHSFLEHYQQMGDSLNNRPINISKRGLITCIPNDDTEV